MLHEPDHLQGVIKMKLARAASTMPAHEGHEDVISIDQLRGFGS